MKKNPFLKQRRSSKYATDEEVRFVEHALYNNLNDRFMEQYKNIHVGGREVKPQMVQAMVGEGVKWTQVTDSPFIVDSNGWIYNASSLKKIKIFYRTTGLLYSRGGNNYWLKEIFEKNGWEYDQAEIVKRHLDEHGFIVASPTSNAFRNFLNSIGRDGDAWYEQKLKEVKDNRRK